MVKSLEVIKEQEVLKKKFKMYGTFDEPLFLAKDVAEWIEYSDRNTSHMCSTVDKDEIKKIFCNIVERTNGTKPVELTGSANRIFLTEDGLYEVLMQSRMPIAKEFKKEVKKILKTIRQTGGYIPIQEDDDEKSILAKAVLIANKTIEKKDKLINQQQEQIEEMKPKVEFAEKINNSSKSVSIGEYAKILCDENGIDVGRNRLFAWMRSNKYLMSDNVPYQKYISYFTVIEKPFVNPKNGEKDIQITTLINGKGQLYFYKKIEDYFGKSNK